MHPTTIGPFHIQRELGRGGMGEVYLAQDSRLDRLVAIKALPAQLAADADGLARFQREAKVLASLNNPGIGAIYGLEEVAGRQYLILEYVEGETLADRLSRGSVPVDEALSLAGQIAGALEAAHDKGIIHRDLKPANVMVTPEGRVKVLDFGLARTGEAAPSSINAPANSPTVVSPTIPGVIMGTAGYMSPEQARGKAVDKRSDIFSFGCVLYEMLTGRGPFPGETVTDSLGAILHREPEWALLPPNTPAAIRRLLVRCLVKDRHRRLRDIGDARIEIESAADEAAEPAAHTARRPVAIAVIALLMLGAGVGGGMWLGGRRGGAPVAEVTRLDMGLQPAAMLGPLTSINRPYQPSFVLTPDGRRVVFAGMVGTATQLFLRSLDAAEAVPIAGTVGASSPFLSPAGDWVGFLAEGEIRKTPITGGPVVKIARLTDGGLASPSPLVPAEEDFFGAAWGEDGVIVFGRFSEGLWQVPAAGGIPKPRSAGKGQIQRLPHFLPHNRGLLLTVDAQEEMGIAVIPPSGGEPKLLIDRGSDGKFMAPSHLLFARDGMLMAAPFDLAKLELTGPPEGLVANLLHAHDGPRPARDVGTAFFDVSASGALVYADGGTYPVEPFRLVWVGRDGTSTPVGMPDGYFARPRLSPDGRRLAVSFAPASARYGDNSLHVYDFERGTLSRLTDRKVGWGPLWSRDGSRIFLRSSGAERGPLAIAADGSSPAVELAKGPSRVMASCELPDRSQLVVVGSSDDTGSDIVLVSPTGEQRPWLNTKANEAWAEISPDGKTMAYGSDASGQFEVYIQPFPGPGPRQQVSIDGGLSPLWAHSGRELFFIHRAGAKGARVTELCVADVSPGVPAQVSKPRVLFSGQYQTLGGLTNYDISLDDQRLILLEVLDVPNVPVSRLHVVLNWAQELRRLTTSAAPR